MLEYILNRQAQGIPTTIGDLAKKFNLTNSEIYDELESGWTGYEVVEGLDMGAIGSANVIVRNSEEIEMTDETVVENVTEEYAEYGDGDQYGEPEAETEPEAQEPVEEVAPKVKRAHFESGIYPNYETEEAAKAAFPEGYTSVAEAHRQCVEQGYSPGKFVRAMGGDKLKFQPMASYWYPFTIGGKVKRYFSNNIFNDFPLLANNKEAKKAERLQKIEEAATAKAAKAAEREQAKAAKEALKAEKAAQAAQASKQEETASAETELVAQEEKPTRKPRKSKVQEA